MNLVKPPFRRIGLHPVQSIRAFHGYEKMTIRTLGIIAHLVVTLSARSVMLKNVIHQQKPVLFDTIKLLSHFSGKPTSKNDGKLLPTAYRCCLNISNFLSQVVCGTGKKQMTDKKESYFSRTRDDLSIREILWQRNAPAQEMQSNAFNLGLFYSIGVRISVHFSFWHSILFLNVSF